MIWKPKEKQLTPEEAIALARKELAPAWFGSPPLLAGVRHGTTATIHPLDSDFAKRGWLILFADPTDYSGLRAIEYVIEWHNRYSNLNLGFLVVLRFPYHDIYTRDSIEDTFLRPKQISFPVTIDLDGSLALGFGVESMPKAVLFRPPNVRIEHSLERSGSKWTHALELDLQRYLRSEDSGLPLLRPMQDLAGLPESSGRIELGKGLCPGMQLKKTAPESAGPGEVILTGAWTIEAHCISTKDTSATMTFQCPDQALALVARSIGKTSEPGTIGVEVNGLPAFDEFAGKELTMTDDGMAVVQITRAWFFRALIDLPPEKRLITFKFPEVDRVPLAIYGLRFGK